MKPCDVVQATGRIFVGGALLVSLAVGGSLGGCASRRGAEHAEHGEHAAAPVDAAAPRLAVVNAYCPVAGDHPVGENKQTTEDLTRVWRGQRVGFCCDQCPMYWDEMDDAEKQETLRTAMELEKTKGPGARRDSDPNVSSEGLVPTALGLERREGPLFR